MDLKEGAEEVAAAQGDHLLWAQGQDWKLGGVCRGGARSTDQTYSFKLAGS